MEKKLIQEVAQEPHVVVQWFVDFYGWAMTVIAILIGVIWRRADNRVTKLEEKAGKCQTKHACKEFRDGIKEDIEKAETDCEKDMGRLEVVVKEFKGSLEKYMDKLEVTNGNTVKEMKESFNEVRESVKELHGRVDEALLKNQKRGA